MKSNMKNLFSFVQKYFLQTSSSSPLPVPSKISSKTLNSASPSSFTVEFLITSCGLPLASALSVSKNLQISQNKLQNAQSVLHFFKSHHFSKADIFRVILKRPGLLQNRVKGNLTPKVEFLIENGFVGQLLPQLVVSNPVILSRALHSHIKPLFERLKSILGTNDKIVVAVKRSSSLLSVNLKGTLQPNLEFLTKEDRVAKLLLYDPRALLKRHDMMVCAVNFLKNLGLELEAPMFIRALRVKLGLSESNWKKRIELMKSIGWSEEVIWGAFKRYPGFLMCSEVKIRKAMDFLVNTFKLEPHTIMKCPLLLDYSIDGRFRPRHNVLKVLLSKKLIKQDKNGQWLLIMSEKDFLKTYVTKYAKKVPGLLEVYGGMSKANKIDT